MVGKAAIVAVAVLAAAATGGTSPAESAFPGANGRIVFEHAHINDIGPSSLYLANPDGTGVVRLTERYADGGQPAWSPDGSRIAFESTRRGDADIYVIRPRRERAQGADLLARVRRRSGLERRRLADRVRDDP